MILSAIRNAQTERAVTARVYQLTHEKVAVTRELDIDRVEDRLKQRSFGVVLIDSSMFDGQESLESFRDKFGDQSVTKMVIFDGNKADVNSLASFVIDSLGLTRCKTGRLRPSTKKSRICLTKVRM